MKSLIGSLVCVSGLVCATSTWSQERAPDRQPERTADPAQQAILTADRDKAEKEATQGRQRMGEIEQGLSAVRQRLGLMGRDRNGAIKDGELAQLYDTAEKARKAAEDKGRELLKADAEGGPILTQIEDLQKKMAELQQQQRDLEKKLMPIAQRMGFQPGRGGREATPALSVDATFDTLRTDAETARKALENKITERLKADPEGAKLLQERDELAATFQAPRERGQDRKPERQP